MSRLLIVEDNPEYRKGARDFFDSVNISPVYAVDYDSALQGLQTPTDFAMIDCFFPKRTGSGDISLGREVVERMAQLDTTEMKMRDGLNALSQYVDTDDPEMRKYARFFIGASQSRDVRDSPIFMAIKQVSGATGKATTTHIAKGTFCMLYKENDAPKDYYTALFKAMDESETNQPLGIEVAEQAAKLGVPLVLVTSTYHHDILTQPIQDYAGRRHWHLEDCMPGVENEKATPKFWQRAYDILKGSGARF